MSTEKTADKERVVLFKVRLSMLVPAVIVFMACFYLLVQKTVNLEIDGEQIVLRTFSTTVGDLLEEQGITIEEKDHVTPPVDTRLMKKADISVSKATKLTILTDGLEISAATRNHQVTDVLSEYLISLAPLDEVSPELETWIEPGMTIQVVRVTTEDITCEVPVGYSIKRNYTLDLPSGTNRVTREGREGTAQQLWQVTFRDGVEVFRQMVSQEVLVKPVDQVLLCGLATAVSRGSDSIQSSRSVRMQATAYTYTGNNTASGVPPHRGAVAVDTSVIPMGTTMYVEGYGHAKALDRGGAIKGNKIDLFFETQAEVTKWGRRWVDVHFYD